LSRQNTKKTNTHKHTHTHSFASVRDARINFLCENKTEGWNSIAMFFSKNCQSIYLLQFW